MTQRRICTGLAIGVNYTNTISVYKRFRFQSSWFCKYRNLQITLSIESESLRDYFFFFIPLNKRNFEVGSCITAGKIMSSRLPINRNKIQRAFKMRGLSIRLDACDAALNVLRAGQEDGNNDGALNLLISAVKEYMMTNSNSSAIESYVVTKQILTVVVSELSKDSQDIMAESVQLLGAFETPRLAYDSMRKEFTLLRNEERSLHAEAEHKVRAKNNNKTNLILNKYYHISPPNIQFYYMYVINFALFFFPSLRLICLHKDIL